MASELEVGKVSVGASASTDTLAGFTDSQAAIVGGDNVGLALQSTNSNKSARVRFFDHSGNQDATVGFDNSTSNLFMGTGTAAHLTISSTGLATFSGGINLGNQTMSSYQTGDWYPLLYYQNSTGVTIGGTAYASQGVGNYTVTWGHYVKVGKLVHVEGYIKVTTANTGSFANDNIGIQGLPFTHRNATNANAMLMVNTTGASGSVASGIVASNSSIAVLQTSSGGSNLADDIGAVTNLKIWINGTYFAET